MLIGLFELPQDTTAVTDDIPLIDSDADNAGMICICCFDAFLAIVELTTFLSP